MTSYASRRHLIYRSRTSLTSVLFVEQDTIVMPQIVRVAAIAHSFVLFIFL